MAIVEYESPVEVLTETEKRARTLEAAALEIEVRGWGQGPEAAFWENGGPVCVLGAVFAAREVIATQGLGRYPTPRYDVSYDVFGKHGNEAWRWNDLRAKSADEATFLLRWRAEEIRDGWDA